MPTPGVPPPARNSRGRPRMPCPREARRRPGAHAAIVATATRAGARCRPRSSRGHRRAKLLARGSFLAPELPQPPSPREARHGSHAPPTPELPRPSPPHGSRCRPLALPAPKLPRPPSRSHMRGSPLASSAASPGEVELVREEHARVRHWGPCAWGSLRGWRRKGHERIREMQE